MNLRTESAHNSISLRPESTGILEYQQNSQFTNYQSYGNCTEKLRFLADLYSTGHIIEQRGKGSTGGFGTVLGKERMASLCNQQSINLAGV